MGDVQGRLVGDAEQSGDIVGGSGDSGDAVVDDEGVGSIDIEVDGDSVGDAEDGVLRSEDDGADAIAGVGDEDASASLDLEVGHEDDLLEGRGRGGTNGSGDVQDKVVFHGKDAFVIGGDLSIREGLGEIGLCSDLNGCRVAEVHRGLSVLAGGPRISGHRDDGDGAHDHGQGHDDSEQFAVARFCAFGYHRYNCSLSRNRTESKSKMRVRERFPQEIGSKGCVVSEGAPAARLTRAEGAGRPFGSRGRGVYCSGCWHL